MKFWIKKYGIIFFLSCVVMILTAIKIFYKPDWSKYKIEEIIPTPTSIPITPTVTIEPTPVASDSAGSSKSTEIKDDKKNYPLSKVLPFEGKYVEIEKYTAPLTLLVKLKKDDKILAGMEVWELFKKEGVDPNSHTFEWQK